jgi:nicotinic acid phosphoribosyltransferase
MVREAPAGKNLILRWDGRDFAEVIPKFIQILEAAQPPRRNSKNHLEWKSNVFLLFTEDMSLERVREILHTVMRAGYAVDRLMFGAGTQMIQKVSRDDFGAVGKITAALKDGAWIDVEKVSKDHPEKRGLAGRLSLSRRDGKWYNGRAESSEDFGLVYGE